MTLRGGVITVEVFKPDASGNLTIPLSLTRIQVPDMTLPIPRLHPNRNFWAYHKSGIFGDYVHPVPPNILPLGTWGRFVNRRFSTERIPLFGGTVPLFATDETEFITRHDTVQTFFLPSGDYRQLFRPGNEVFDFVAVPNSGPYPNLRHMLSDEGGGALGIVQTTSFVPDVPIPWRNVNVAPILTKSFYAARLPDVSASWTFGDWDIGSPMRTTDGPLINKPDEGNQNQIGQPGDDPYWFAYGGVNTGDNVTEGVKYHTANRQISSPVMFGSLPTGMVSGNPWQTLLFRPTPPGHPGAQEPPDHLLLDLFWMPVVEPYAISEPFSTAGKVNMNYQIVPFTYIERSTGMHAVLQNENILAVPETGWGGFYGKHWNSQTTQYNLQINVNETLTPFRQKFSQGGVFLTPSEITQVHLVPNSPGVSYNSMDNFWNARRLTAENLKERPYSYIYPRLTTKSNVFTVHHRVQALKKRPGSAPGVWNEDLDKNVAEHRGSTVIERFIDMNRPGIPDFATTSNVNAETLYRTRILSTSDFNP